MSEFVDNSVRAFNDYYPNLFDNKTLVIPSSNDLVNNYFYGKFAPNDHPSMYNEEQIKLHKENKQKMQKEIEQLTNLGKRIERMAQKIVDDAKKQRMIEIGKKWTDKAKVMQTDMNRSDQPWNKLTSIQKNREKESIAKLIFAFRQNEFNVGGVLIQSPNQNKELKNFITEACNNYPTPLSNYREFENFPEEFSRYPELCDCIYFHDHLGIYTIEVKATKELNPVTVDMRNRMTPNQAKNNAYEKAVMQLARMLTPSSIDQLSIWQKLYALITGSQHNFPRMSGIVCTPEARLSNVQSPQLLDERFYHFDAQLLLTKETFRQFWIDQLQQFPVALPLLADSNYRKFISVMAYCSVGRELFGVKNALNIAKQLTAQKIDPTQMSQHELCTDEHVVNTIYLNNMQSKILQDKSKYKIVYGPPGTGKTLLVILAAIDAATNRKSNGRVIVFTRMDLIASMRTIFALNGFDETAIEVKDIVLGCEDIDENNSIFTDEVAIDSGIAQWLNTVKETENISLFFAISAQAAIDELDVVEENLKEILRKVGVNCLIFPLTEEQRDVGVYCMIFPLTEVLRGTRSIVAFWMERLNKMLRSSKLQMDCGHSIIGDTVDYRKYLTSGEIMEAMTGKVKDLMIKNDEPKSIAIICCELIEKQLIESALTARNIAFGSAGPIVVELVNNVYSREWPFVIAVSTSPSYSNRFSIIAASRALAHLTVLERDEQGVWKQMRARCGDNDELRMRICTSPDDYQRLRGDMKLTDESQIMVNDFLMQIIANNHLPPQIRQLFPMAIEETCDTFDQFFDIIVNFDQWILLLFVHRWDYCKADVHPNQFIQLVFVHMESKELMETYEIDDSRRSLNENTKLAIKLINRYIRTEAQEKMKAAVGKYKHLFDRFDKSDQKYQLDLIANATRKWLLVNSARQHVQRQAEIRLDTSSEIDEQIEKLLVNFQHMPQ